MSRVLVVEDNKSDIAIVKFLMLQFGYEVDFVNNVYDAEDLLNIHSYDLMLLDWMLPKVSGISYLRSLKKSGRHTNLPIMMMTSKNESNDIKTALKEGVSDYIIKPIDPVIFKNKIGVVLAKSDKWTLTPVSPESTASSFGTLKEAARLVSLSEVQIQFESSISLNQDQVYSFNFPIFNQLELGDIHIRITRKTDFAQKNVFVYLGQLIGLKEEDLKKIRLLCRSFQMNGIEAHV